MGNIKNKLITKTLMGLPIVSVGIATPILSTSCGTPTTLTLSYTNDECLFILGQTGITYNPILKDNNGNKASGTFQVVDGKLPEGLMLNSTTGEISGTPTELFNAEITITANGTNEWVGISTSQELLIKVTSPIPSPTNLYLVYDYDEYTFYIDEQNSTTEKPTLIDNNNNSASARFSVPVGSLPSGLSINENTGVISGKPTTEFQGTVTITAIGTNDWEGLQISQDIWIEVVPNPNPTSLNLTYKLSNFIFEISNESSTETPTLNDNNGNPATATFSVPKGSLPSSLSINENTGEISGTPSTEGEYEVAITAIGTNDWEGLQASQDISIKVVSVIPEPTNLTLNYGSNDFTFRNNGTEYTTGIPTLKDNNNYSASATFELISGKLPDGLSLNHDTGEISGTLTKLYYDNVTIKATGTNIWEDLESTETITIDVTNGNSICLTNDGLNKVVEIKKPDLFMLINDPADGRLTKYRDYLSSAISHVNQIKKIHITPDQTIAAAADNYGAYLCYGMTNLTVADVNLSSSITSVSTHFYYQAFRKCTSLTSLTSTFNIPQSITSINGDHFCAYMFAECSALEGSTESSDQNFKSPITESTDQYYAAYMFDGATKLTGIGYPISPNVDQLHSGYNISRSE